MAKQLSAVRKQVLHQYTLTDQLQVQLQVLGSTPATVGARFEADLDDLVVSVFLEAGKTAQDDLRAILAQVQSINREREKLRKVLQDTRKRPHDIEGLFHLVATLYGKQIESEIVEIIKDRLDSLSEMGELESLRLQMAMDRLSKMMSTLSNILKKISDTSSQIVQNLK